MYVLTLITGGAFSFIWLSLMLRDADRIAHRRAGEVAPFILPGMLVMHFILYAFIVGLSATNVVHYALVVMDLLLTISLIVLMVAFVLSVNSRVRAAQNLPRNFGDAIA